MIYSNGGTGRSCFRSLASRQFSTEVYLTMSGAGSEPLVVSSFDARTDRLFTLNADPVDLSGRYRSAEPFPHIAIDGLFRDSDLQRVLDVFPNVRELDWAAFDNSHEKKLGYRHGTLLPEVIELFLYRMNSYVMLQFLERLTGIEGLIPDPYFGGGGLHQIEPGGFLGVHADFNVHPLLKLDRRLNMLVYLNKDWEDEYGGALELWDRDMSRCVKSIAPVFNRTVIFSTTDTSFHGHPKPLACPPDRTRRSLSLYYYTNGRPEDERSAPHDTIFR